MRCYFNGFLISDEKELLQLDRIHQLLSTTYLASKRDVETIKESIMQLFSGYVMLLSMSTFVIKVWGRNSSNV